LPRSRTPDQATRARRAALLASESPRSDRRPRGFPKELMPRLGSLRRTGVFGPGQSSEAPVHKAQSLPPQPPEPGLETGCTQRPSRAGSAHNSKSRQKNYSKAKGRARRSNFGCCWDLLCNAVFQHWLFAADLLQGQLAAFAMEYLEAGEAAATKLLRLRKSATCSGAKIRHVSALDRASGRRPSTRRIRGSGLTQGQYGAVLTESGGHLANVG
jgi:hypothetical protein